MWQHRKRSLSWVFVSRMIGIISFLIIVVLAKILENFTSPVGIYQKAAEGLLFANFWLLLLIAIIFLVADLFIAIPFPLNLPGPVIKAIGSVFCIALVLNVFQWIDSTAGTNIYQIFWLLSFVLVPLIFFIVLLTGYFEIGRQLLREPKPSTEDGTVVIPTDYPQAGNQPVSDAKSWEEIGAEFRLMLYDIVHRFRQEIKRK
jgi:hypothetical protein